MSPKHRKPARHTRTSRPAPFGPHGWIAGAVAVFLAASAFGLSQSTASVFPNRSDSNAAARTATPAAFNGSFDAGTGGWFVLTGDVLSRAPGRRDGAAARVTQKRHQSATAVLNDRSNSLRDTVAGQTYTASAWVRTTTPNVTVDLRLMEWPRWAAGVRYAPLGEKQKWVWLRDTGWHQLAVSYRAAKSGSSLDLNVIGWQMRRGTSFDVDDIGIGGVRAASVPTESAPTGAPAPPPSASSAPSAAPSAPPSRRVAAASAVDRILPAKGRGAVLGFYQRDHADIRPIEAKAQARFGAVHRYRDFDGSALWPSKTETDFARQGRLVHFSWETMSYSGRYNSGLQPAPAKYVRDAHSKQQRRVWTYKQITNGSMNRYIDAIAARVKAAPGNYLIDFNHEADDTPDMGGSNTQRAAAGSRSEYAAAYRHLVNRFRAKGVKNVAWGWTLSGWYTGDRAKWSRLGQMWPGKGYVDVIMWDPYNSSKGRWESFSQTISGPYRALKAGMLDRVDPTAKNLRFGLGEFGSIRDSRRPGWLRQIPATLRSMPEIVYANYFSAGQWADLSGDGASISALGDAADDDWFR